jgi:hypothetical protein
VGVGVGGELAGGGNGVGVSVGVGLAVGSGAVGVGVEVGVGVTSSTVGVHITVNAIRPRLASKGHTLLLWMFIDKSPSLLASP